jgi:hypothetical protein
MRKKYFPVAFPKNYRDIKSFTHNILHATFCQLNYGFYFHDLKKIVKNLKKGEAHVLDVFPDDFKPPILRSCSFYITVNNNIDEYYVDCVSIDDRGKYYKYTKHERTYYLT